MANDKLETPTAYQLEVLKMETSDDVEFLSVDTLHDNGIIVGTVIKANKNGKLYLSTRNENKERTQAIYFGRELTAISKVGQTVDFNAVQFSYTTPQEGVLESEGPNKGQQKKPYFTVCRVGTEDEWYSKKEETETEEVTG